MSDLQRDATIRHAILQALTTEFMTTQVVIPRTKRVLKHEDRPYRLTMGTFRRLVSELVDEGTVEATALNTSIWAHAFRKVDAA